MLRGVLSQGYWVLYFHCISSSLTVSYAYSSGLGGTSFALRLS